ncbi:ASCH domain-containing protein [Companilactobacillus sp. DQM5]|uniref:ASCH domain-containing protein n=1 Tax=Companilactobacillus sp. DQM5 TaxID=3463359 RepID=UPI004059FDD0
MKALSIRPDFVADIVTGRKHIEYRSWSTKYRGPILICSTARKISGTIPGYAQALVNIVDVKKLADNKYAWMLDDISVIVPIPIKGQQRIFNVDTELEDIQIPEFEDDEGEDQFFNEYYKPLIFE